MWFCGSTSHNSQNGENGRYNILVFYITFVSIGYSSCSPYSVPSTASTMFNSCRLTEYGEHRVRRTNPTIFNRSVLVGFSLLFNEIPHFSRGLRPRTPYLTEYGEQNRPSQTRVSHRVRRTLSTANNYCTFFVSTTVVLPGHPIWVGPATHEFPLNIVYR